MNSGGSDHVSQVEEYDPATDTWTRKADIPTARSGVGASAVDGKIYGIGGWAGSIVSTVEEYDPGFTGPKVGDFNGDQKVDFNDFAIFAQSAYDDGEFDAEALAAFAGSWLWKATEEAWGPSPEEVRFRDFNISFAASRRSFPAVS